MYTKLYGLRERPFNLTPDPRFLYHSAAHREGLAQMIYGVNNRRGFIVVTGEVGTGKTTLIRTLLEQLDSRTRTAYLYHAILGIKGLYQSICRDFGIPFKGRETRTDLLYILQDFLFSLKESDENAVLIIDEAQNLKPHILEEIRLISNMETTDTKLIQLLLVGQPEFGKILDRNEVRQLKQRIALRYHLTRLSRDEMKSYIKHRLYIAGYHRRTRLFTSETLDEIFLISRGIPRSINILCENALVMGYSLGADRITPEIVGKVRFTDEYQQMDDLPIRKSEEIEIKTFEAVRNDLSISTIEPEYYRSEPKISLLKKMKRNIFFWRKKNAGTSMN